MGAVQQYDSLMESIQLLQSTRMGFGITGIQNPAWVKLYHAGEYLAKQARELLDA